MRGKNRVLSALLAFIGKATGLIRSRQQRPKLKARTGEIDPTALLMAMRKQKKEKG